MNKDNKVNKVIPVQKGDILKLGVVAFGSNGDFIFKKDGYSLFLKNANSKGVSIGQTLKIKVVKIFPKLGYVELL